MLPLITFQSKAVGEDHSQQPDVDITKHDGQDDDTAVLSASGEDMTASLKVVTISFL